MKQNNNHTKMDTPKPTGKDFIADMILGKWSQAGGIYQMAAESVKKDMED